MARDQRRTRRGARVAPGRRVLVIGIGAGDPEHLTLGAVRALNETDVVFLIDKGDVADEMRRVRLELCRRVIDPAHDYRIVEVQLPAVRHRGGHPGGGSRAGGHVPGTTCEAGCGPHPGGGGGGDGDDDGRADKGFTARAGDADAAGYDAEIATWREERVARYAELIGGLGNDETGAFLVWGDPTLYDGTLAVLDEVRADGGVRFEVEVIPGISSVSALAARHGVALNRVGEAVQITTGRRLARDGMPPGVDNVVVMLDAHEAWRQLDGDLNIYWGAFVGLPGERLVAGRLADQRTAIERQRRDAQQDRGWIFDTYLLRRPSNPLTKPGGDT